MRVAQHISIAHQPPRPTSPISYTADTQRPRHSRTQMLLLLLLRK